MPLYEYQCPNDGRFEVIRKFSDPPLTACPTCGAEVHKLLSAPAIQFKGTGWYITDYARKGKDAPKTENGASSSSSESKSDTKESKSEGKESKTETKKESAPAKSESSSTSTTTT